MFGGKLTSSLEISTSMKTQLPGINEAKTAKRKEVKKINKLD